MKKNITILFMGLMVFALGITVSRINAGNNETSAKKEIAAKLAIDVSKPETWKASVKKLIQTREEMTDALISIAKDEKRSNDNRRNAILLLPELGTNKGLDFLFENISFYIPMFLVKGDGDAAMEWPCRTVLPKYGWDGAHAILEKKNIANRTRDDLVRLSSAFRSCLHSNELSIPPTELSVRIIDLMLKTSSVRADKEWSKSLTLMRTFIDYADNFPRANGDKKDAKKKDKGGGKKKK